MGSIDHPFAPTGTPVDGLVFCTEFAGHRVEVFLQCEDGRVFDVWGHVHGDWAVFLKDGDKWVLTDVDERPEVLRFWLVDEEVEVPPEPPASPKPVDVYMPLVDGEPPLPEERTEQRLSSRLVSWQEARSKDVLVAVLLDEWTDSATTAASLGWMSGLPRGEDLLAAFIKSPGASRLRDEFDRRFVLWLSMELGLSVRRGATERRHLEERREPVRVVSETFARLVRALQPQLEVVFRAPHVLAPKDEHAWLVDRRYRERLEPGVPVAEPFRPVFVLRPLLRDRTGIVLAGEVI